MTSSSHTAERRSIPPESDTLRHAKAYARLGWHVFPLAPRSKVPAGSLVLQGHHGATRDDRQLTHWYDAQPDLGIGIAMQPSGLILLDVDPRHGGDETLAQLEREHGALPPTIEALTGGGGAHFLFRRPDGLVPHDYIALWPGIDVKALGYAVVAPSVHPDTGQAYRWAIGYEPGRLAAAQLPAWVAAAMVARRNGHQAAHVPDRILEGGRNAALASLGGTMRRRGMSPDAIEAALQAENAARCDPPLSENEVQAITRSVSKYAPESPRTSREAVEEAPHRELVVHAAENERVAVAAAPTAWLVEGLWALGAITECAAKIKAGKTSFTLAMVKALIAGDSFLGLAATPQNVLYLTEERPATFRAALARHGLGSGLSVVYRHECFGMPWPEVASQASAWCLENGATGLVVDTLSTWAGFTDDNENSAGAGMEAILPLEQAAAADLAVWYCRHDRKGGGELGESGRGTSALAGAADILLQLKRGDTEGHENRRVLAGIGRFDNVPGQLVIELTETGYTCLGDALAVEQAKVEAWLRDHLPPAAAPATKVDLLTGLGSTASKSTLDRVLEKLVASGFAAAASKGYGPSKRAAGFWRVAE